MGTLYIVATPIGNLEDTTIRALRILEEVDLIACEDTRHSGILLKHFDIHPPSGGLVSFHQHSKLKKIQFLISKLLQGKDLALITDSGTPGISDPAGVLIAEAFRAKLRVVPIPGPSALTALLSVIGQPMERFLFLGFLPKKKGRQTLLKNLSNSQFPIVFFESPNRILKTLQEMQQMMGDCYIIVGRELTKKYEEIYCGQISAVLEKIKPQGEFVVAITK